MVRVHIWLRKKEGMSADAFRDYWLNNHAPIARDGYENLRGYVVNLVTRVPEGQEAPYDGVAELTWDDREGFSVDMKRDAAKRATADLANFTAASGLLFVDQTIVKEAAP
ncbi:MAG: EthD domain-containing protein [Actinomycetota bacterium]